MRAIRSLPAFPEDGQIEIIEAGRGSFKANLALYSSLVGAFAGVGSFAKDIVDLIRQPDTELARCVAWTMVEDGVTKVGIRCAGDYEVLRHQMPAVSRVLDMQAEASRQKDSEEQRRGATSESDIPSVPDNAIGYRAGPVNQLGKFPDHSTFSNIPPEPENVQLPGRFSIGAGGPVFVQPNGQVGLLKEEAGHQEFPLEVPVIARLAAVRGPRGGWADRRIRVIDWILAEDHEAPDETQIARDFWRRGGDDEEFDLPPGQQSNDLRTISDPGQDLYDERASIEQQPTAGFIGELVSDGDDILLVTEDGETFLLDGGEDYPNPDTPRMFVVVGRAGLEGDDNGRCRLLVQEVIPLHSPS